MLFHRPEKKLCLLSLYFVPNVKNTIKINIKVEICTAHASTNFVSISGNTITNIKVAKVLACEGHFKNKRADLKISKILNLAILTDYS